MGGSGSYGPPREAILVPGEPLTGFGMCRGGSARARRRRAGFGVVCDGVGTPPGTVGGGGGGVADAGNDGRAVMGGGR